MGSKMKPEVKQEWIRRLRDPAEKQTTGYLRRRNGGMCCLGVLCDVYLGMTGRGRWEPRDEFMIFRGEYRSDFLPHDEIVEWSGLRQGQAYPAHGGFRIEDVKTPELRERIESAVDQSQSRYTLAEMNDNGFTFEDIAQVIEEVF